jgi:ABC-type cobalamin/Fe3+-siderophores transport system ATPase subunit
MLQLIDVYSRYGKKNVLQGINLEVKENEIFALIGLNGSGKSTLLRTALGLIKTTQGEILINKNPLRNLSLSERSKNISLLESSSKTSFAMSVEELLKVADRNNRYTQNALKAVGLEGFEKKNILQLSSGEAQRAFIAHALATNSKCIMLDEPLTHLDWSHQTQLIDSLKEWKDKYATTFVLAIHELEKAVQVADRMGLIVNGKIKKCGTPQEIFSDRETLETFAFKACIDENLLDGSKRLTLGKIK